MRRPREGRSLVVFAWHNVATTWFSPSPRRTSLRGLHRQLLALSAGFNVVPLSESLERLYTGRRLPPRAACITFDDGYRDNLELAAPLLEHLRLPATFFLVPRLLDGGRAWWEALAWAFARTTRPELDWEGERWPLGAPPLRLEALNVICERLKTRDLAEREWALDELTGLLAPRGAYGDGLFLDWDGAGRLARRPGVEIGSHSRDHAILSQETPPSQMADLAEARRRLEGRLGVPALVLAYPNGTSADYDGHTIAAAKAAGHRWSLTARTGVNRPDTPSHEIRRAMISPGDGVHGLIRPWPLRRWRRDRS